MGQRKSAQKTLKGDKKRRQYNLIIRRKIRDVTKKYLKAIESNNLDKAKEILSSVYKQLDKAASKKYIHKNKASRRKARLAKKLKSLKS